MHFFSSMCHKTKNHMHINNAIHNYKPLKRNNMQIKTYTTDTRYDIDGNVTFEREFSEGEFMNEDDLILTEDRSTTFYVEDDIDAEEFYSTYINVARLTPEESMQSYGDAFRIGNNIAGGI